MKFSFTTMVVFLIAASTQAQTKPNFKKQAQKEIAAEFPRFRFLNIDYNHSFARNFDSELFGNDFQTGEISNQKTVNIAVNFPIMAKGKWSLTGSANYKYNQFEFNNLKNISNTTNFVQSETANFHNFSTALNSTYFSVLFKKPVIYNTSLIIDGSNQGFERIKGMIGASLVLKRTANTTMTAGIIVFVDKTSQLPFFPTFTYNYKFNNSPWEFDFILPQRIQFRRSIATKGRLSLGTEFGGNGFYVNTDGANNFPKVLEYSQLEINLGAIYEHKLSNQIIATFKGGLTNFISNRLTEKGKPNKDFLYQNTQKSTGYFNIGISFNPFSKK